MGCKPEHYATFLQAVFTLENMRGALVTMPHKVTTVALLDEASPTVRIAGACNAVRRGPDGRLQGDMFDGEGFVRGLRRKGCQLEGARVLVVGCGGVGSAIAASLAAAGVAAMGLFDARAESAHALGQRLRDALSRAVGAHRPQRPGRIRHRRQRHAAGHERRRPDADGRVAHRARAPSSARW